jgi:membrane protease YdiL (CAAX protease family)
MTAIPLQTSSWPRIVRPVALLTGIAVIVVLRRTAVAAGATDALIVGEAFGAGLLLLALAAGWRPRAEKRRAVAAGVVGGAVLVGLAVLTRSGSLPSLAPAVDFLPWAAVTILVATAEEIILRGAILDALGDALGGTAGLVAPIVITAAVFALMHVPVYGWQAVPLDFGVGLWFGGLRLSTGGIAAPAIAHSIADLATWWL